MSGEAGVSPEEVQRRINEAHRRLAAFVAPTARDGGADYDANAAPCPGCGHEIDLREVCHVCRRAPWVPSSAESEGDDLARDVRTLRQMRIRMLDGDPIVDRDRSELATDLANIANRLEDRPSATPDTPAGRDEARPDRHEIARLIEDAFADDFESRMKGGGGASTEDMAWDAAGRVVDLFPEVAAGRDEAEGAGEKNPRLTAAREVARAAHEEWHEAERPLPPLWEWIADNVRWALDAIGPDTSSCGVPGCTNLRSHRHEPIGVTPGGGEAGEDVDDPRGTTSLYRLTWRVHGPTGGDGYCRVLGDAPDCRAAVPKEPATTGPVTGADETEEKT